MKTSKHCHTTKNVIVIDEEPVIVSRIASHLQELPMKVESHVVARKKLGECRELINLAHADVVIVGPSLIKAAKSVEVVEFFNSIKQPVIVISSELKIDAKLVAAIPCIFGVISSNLADKSLAATIEIAINQWQHRVELIQKVKVLENRLKIRKAVTRSTGMLVDQFNISDSEAYKRVQEISIRANVPLIMAADAVIRWKRGRLTVGDASELLDALQRVIIDLAITAPKVVKSSASKLSKKELKANANKEKKSKLRDANIAA